VVIRRATVLLGRGQGRLSPPARRTVAAGLALAQVLPEPPNATTGGLVRLGHGASRATRYRDDRAWR
jgi:hypothetical protein